MPKLIRRVSLLLFALMLAFPAVFAQDLPDRKTNQKPEVPKAYRDWIDKDVAYIITEGEKAAFKKLKTNEEREQFIEIFWRRRDPDPDTDENEYREEYYERIAYANEHFTSGIPGWKTDRGRVYIMYGKPDEKETHPMGGHYDRPSYQGGGSTTTYPFEIWFYRYLPGIGSGIEIEFVDPTGSGEYRIARSPDEKDALLNVPGAGLTLAEELGLADKTTRILGQGGNNSYGFSRAQDQPFERLLLINQLSQAPQIKFKDLEDRLGVTGGPVIEENPLDFNVRVDFFRQSEDRVIAAITVQTENRDLVFEDSGGIQRARLNIYGRIISVAGRRIGIFEDAVETNATAEELAEAKERKSIYQKAYPLAPGTYKVEVIVRDIASGATGVQKHGFTVPKYDSKQLNTSTLVLAARLENMKEPTGQFMIGQTKVVPNLSRQYRRGQPVGLYLQVYNVGTDQTTLRPSVDVQYVLTQGGKEVGKQSEDWQGLADYGQRLTLARLIDTSRLTAGEYGIEIRIRDRVSGQTIKQEDKFTVSQ